MFRVREKNVFLTSPRDVSFTRPKLMSGRGKTQLIKIIIFGSYTVHVYLCLPPCYSNWWLFKIKPLVVRTLSLRDSTVTAYHIRSCTIDLLYLWIFPSGLIK